jgi:hypothetical protein
MYRRREKWHNLLKSTAYSAEIEAKESNKLIEFSSPPSHQSRKYTVINESPQWKSLEAHAAATKGLHLSTLMQVCLCLLSACAKNGLLATSTSLFHIIHVLSIHVRKFFPFRLPGHVFLNLLRLFLLPMASSHLSLPFSPPPSSLQYIRTLSAAQRWFVNTMA